MRVLMTLLLALPLSAASPFVVPLYPGDAPGSESANWPETLSFGPNDTVLRIANVTRPSLMVFLPEPSAATGAGIVVCPGGAFRFLAFNHEGTEVAEWLNSIGVAAFVLKYRLARTGDAAAEKTETAGERRKQAMAMAAADGLEALRLVRSRAAEWNVDPARIGILGFSAGGYVAARTAFSPDAETRPSFAALVYPFFPDEMKPPAGAPPLFLVHADDDTMVPPARNSVRLYNVWKEAGLPAEMHIYQQGGHGFSMRRKNLPVAGWTERFREWMAAQGWLRRSAR